MAERRSLHTREPLVGRDVEIETVQAALDQVHRGHGRLLLISGEPGIGKTRLVEELAALAAEQGSVVATGRPDDMEGAPPYRPWAQLLHAVIVGAGIDGAGITGAALEDNAGPLAAILAGVAPGSGPPPPLEPAAARFRLHDAVVDFLARVSARRSLVLVLDDLHWADQASLELARFAAARLTTAPVLLVLTYRSVDAGRDGAATPGPFGDALGSLARSPRLTRIDLRGLTPAEVGRFMDQTIGLRSRPAAVATVHARTDGNPFFVGGAGPPAPQRGSSHGRRQPGPPGRAGRRARRRPPPPGAPAVPDQPAAEHRGRHRAGVRPGGARLRGRPRCGRGRGRPGARAGGRARPGGRRVDRPAEVLPRPDPRHRLRRARIPAQRHAPRQGRCGHRPALHRTRPLPRRRAGLALLPRRPGRGARAGAPPRAGGRRGRADRPRVRAGGGRSASGARSHRAHDVRAAAARTGTARPEPHRRAATHDEGPGRRGVRRGVHPRQGAVHPDRRVRRPVRHPLRAVAVPRHQLRVHAAGRAGRAVLAVGRQHGHPAWLVAGHLSVGCSELHAGSLPAALDDFETTVALARDLTAADATLFMEHPLTVALQTCALTAWFCGDEERARAMSDEAVVIATGWADPLTTVDALYSRNKLAVLTGDPARTLAEAEPVLTLCEEHGLGMFHAWIRAHRGWALCHHGRTEEGLAEIEAGLVANQAGGGRMNTPFLLGLLADGEALAGHPERALAAVDDALALIRASEGGLYEADLHRRRGELLTSLGPEHVDDAAAHRAAHGRLDRPDPGRRSLRPTRRGRARDHRGSPTADRPPGTGSGPEPGGSPSLSPRERVLLALVGQGRTDKEIAAELVISLATVRSHMDRIRDKTGRRRRAELTRLAVDLGLIRP